MHHSAVPTTTTTHARLRRDARVEQSGSGKKAFRCPLRVEVAIDLALMVATNLAAQWVFYHGAVTLERLVVFAALMVAPAGIRRRVTRGVFHRVWPRQTWWQSLAEVAVDTALGWLYAVGVQLVVYADATTMEYAGGVTLACYGVTLLRRYGLRWVMQRWEERSA